jgi:hypothetical protein
MKIESRPGGKDIEAWQLARELTRKMSTSRPDESRMAGLPFVDLSTISKSMESAK